MARIERLTPQQEAELPAFREHWRSVGLSTAPVDPEASRKAVRNLYAAGGQTEPTAVIVLASPMACLIARGIVKLLIKDNLGDDQRAALERKLGDQLRGQLWDQLRGQLWDQLRGQLGDQDLFQSSWMIGGQDAFWLAFYEYGENIGAKYGDATSKHLEAYKAYAINCGWLYPYKQIAFVSDRPEFISFDEEGRLHCADGMAVRFQDGWGVTAWHGTLVPDEWMAKPETLTPAVALACSNLEQRRAACEILGWSRMLEQLGARVIDADGDPQIGTLVEVDLPGTEDRQKLRARFLRVECGTGREFAICVPPSCGTAIGAQAWCQGLDVKDWRKPEVRT